MTRCQVFTFSLFAFALGGVARAHTNPARRAVAVQAEKNAAVILVEWTVPSGEDGFAYGGVALFGRHGKDARDALAATLAAKAVGPLDVTLDGAPVTVEPQVKITEDPPRSGRLAGAVLLVVPVAKGEHELRVALRPGADMTTVATIDRSDGRARFDEQSDPELLPGRPLVAHFR